MDEAFLTTHAADMWRHGDPNPHFFKYPSFPIYLTAIAMKLSSFVSGPSASTEWAVPVLLGAPYSPPSIYLGPRILFALLSIAALAGVGVVAQRLYRDQLPLFLAPLILATSHAFQHSATNYLNVDVVTLAFVMATLTVILVTWERDTYLAQSILPGVLSGIAVASKYNSGLVLLPAMLRIVFSSKDRVRRLAVLGACAAAAFFVFVPYSILDHATFLQDVAWEIRHYRTGHKNYEGEAGLPQLLFYLSALASDLGVVTLGFAIVGLVFGFLVDRKRTAAIASFPVAMLLHMSTNRVHFLRTVLPVFALTTVFAAGGFAGIAVAVRRAIARFVAPKWPLTEGRAVLWSRGFVVAVIAGYLPTLENSILLDRNIHGDSRNVVVGWLREHAAGAPVFVPPEAFFSPDALETLNAKKTARGMSDLPELIVPNGSNDCYVVTPTYDGSRAALRNADRVLGALRERGAAQVLAVDGKALDVPPAKGRIMPVSNPALAIYRARCGGQR